MIHKKNEPGVCPRMARNPSRAATGQRAAPVRPTIISEPAPNWSHLDVLSVCVPCEDWRCCQLHKNHGIFLLLLHRIYGWRMLGRRESSAEPMAPGRREPVCCRIEQEVQEWRRNWRLTSVGLRNLRQKGREPVT